MKTMMLMMLLGFTASAAQAADQYNCAIHNALFKDTSDLVVYNQNVTVDVTKLSEVMAGGSFRSASIIQPNHRKMVVTIMQSDTNQFDSLGNVSFELQVYENEGRDTTNDFVTAIGSNVQDLQKHVRSSSQNRDSTTKRYDEFGLDCTKI